MSSAVNGGPAGRGEVLWTARRAPGAQARPLNATRGATRMHAAAATSASNERGGADEAPGSATSATTPAVKQERGATLDAELWGL